MPKKSKPAYFASETERTKFLSCVLNGGEDDHLADIFNTILGRFATGETGPRWRIVIPDVVTITEDDLTLTEAAKWEELTGQAIAEFQPLLPPGPKAGQLLAFIEARLGLDHPEVGKLTMTQVSDALSWDTVAPDPKDTSAGK